jgi:hypothetical protein
MIKHVLIDMMGQRFGRLTVLEIAARAQRKTNPHTKWKCVCDCGKEVIVIGKDLRVGHTKSCGCLLEDNARNLFRTHGDAGKGFSTREYIAWSSMRGRCLNPNNGKYYRYGARGIKVCERWDSYENFLMDMGKKPSPRHSLDRINVHGDYEPSNCRWLSPKGQYWNREVSLNQLFVEVARGELSKDVFDTLWQKTLKFKDEKADGSV